MGKTGALVGVTSVVLSNSNGRYDVTLEGPLQGSIPPFPTSHK